MPSTKKKILREKLEINNNSNFQLKRHFTANTMSVYLQRRYIIWNTLEPNASAASHTCTGIQWNVSALVVVFVPKRFQVEDFGNVGDSVAHTNTLLLYCLPALSAKCSRVAVVIHSLLMHAILCSLRCLLLRR